MPPDPLVYLCRACPWVAVVPEPPSSCPACDSPAVVDMDVAQPAEVDAACWRMAELGEREAQGMGAQDGQGANT